MLRPPTVRRSGGAGHHDRSVATTVGIRRSPKNYASFENEYASLKNAIVRINSVGCDGNNYVGSGFVIDAHHIVTAGHVVEGSQSITVTIGGNPEPTEIIGLDTSGDVALLHSDGTIPGSYIPLANDDPPVGDRVAAIGFPLAPIIHAAA
jgi:S1-C subfamily serine protease